MDSETDIGGVMELVETGFCKVIKDDNDKLCWVTNDDGSKDGYKMNPNEPLQMLPQAFGEGTIIRINQPANITGGR